MPIRIRPNCRELWLVIFLTVLTLTDFIGKALEPKRLSNIEFSFLNFIKKLKLRNVSSNLNGSNKKPLKKAKVPFHSSAFNISSTIKRDVNFNNEIFLKNNVSISELSKLNIEFGNNYVSLLPLLLGKERFDLVLHTIQNELKLYNSLKTFPKKIDNIEKYIQLYTICSYLSPILSCEIKKVSNTLENFFNITSTLYDISNNITHINPLYNKKLNSHVTEFPWVSSKYSYKWNVISGTYGDVVCGKIFGGNKSIISHSQDFASFFFSTYIKFKSKEYVAFILVSEAHETNLAYKQLEPGKDINVCLKSFRSVSYPEYFMIWNDENFNLKWLERETWLSGLSNNEIYIKFTPSQVFIVPRMVQNTNNLNGNILVTQTNENSSHICVKDCENSIFYPSVYESHYPWNTASGRFWSSYLIMERFIGPSFSDISNFLILDSVIDWTKISRDNFYIWSASLIHIAYLFFSALISFTFTGSLLYQHCDLHASNLILLIKNWKTDENYLFSRPNFQLSFKETITEILSSSIKEVKIIDLTYVTYLNNERRSLSLVCETFGEVSITDIENWIVFIYNLKKDVDNVLSKHHSLSRKINPLSILIELLETDIDFNSTKPKYIGGSELWWKNWIFNQNKFDDLYDSVLGVGSFFNQAINQVESLLFQNENILFFVPLKLSYFKTLKNPILFEIYLKELFYVPHSILSFGTCIYQHEKIYNNQIYFLTAAEVLTHYFLIHLQTEPDIFPSWIHKNQFGSKLLWNKCVKSNHLFSKSISQNLLEEFYYEPCFAEFCVTKKPFSKKIKLWIQEDNQDRDSFFNSCRKLIALSTNKISFTLSILILNQIKFNIKNFLMNYDKLLQISMDFSNSISNHIINIIHQNKSVHNIHIFLSFCLSEYQKYLLLFISLSDFNFGEKLCSKIYKAIFIKFTNT